jgi:AraC-like DNA-binding protein
MDAVVPIVCVAGCALADLVPVFSWVVLAWSEAWRAPRRAPVEIVAVVPDERSGTEKPKYGNNRLPGFARESIVAELQRHMQAEQPWLKIDLTLGELAAAINVSPHHLSQIINSEFGKTFACYINEYRVGEACQLLAGDSGKSVLDVALDSGFSSKSSFNASFKKHTGMTPSEYRKSPETFPPRVHSCKPARADS